MICMTKEEGTYLSFAHRLLREVPGLSKFLYATGTDDEIALRNAASFQAAHPLLCYLHSERNVKEKARQLGLSSQFTSRICKDVYSKTGLIWLNSKEEFQIQLQRIPREWDATEAAERVGPPKFSNYFSRNKVEDIQSYTAKFAMKKLGLSEEPYPQNLPESMSDMMKTWTSFVPQEMDSFIISLFDFEEEMAWFGTSEKWQVKQEYRRYMPAKRYAEMSSEERTKEVKRNRNLQPDGKAYKECRDFKFAISCKPSTSGNTCPVVSKATAYSDEYVQSILTPHFSRKEASSMVQKANVIIHNKGIREGFSSGTSLVDSGTKLPYRVSCLKSGKVSCSCPAFGRNNLCRHSLAVALQQMCVDKMMSQFSGRSLTRLSTSTAPKNVGAKGASRKRGASFVTPNSESTDCGHHEKQLTSEATNDTTVVMRKAPKPSIPVATAPLVLKVIAGGIRKCAGCCKPISTIIPGYDAEQDHTLCFGRFEAYTYWNKAEGSHKVATSTRHYHLNPVCTGIRDRAMNINIGVITPDDNLRALLVERFNYHLP